MSKKKSESPKAVEKQELSLDNLESLVRSIPFPRLLKIPSNLKDEVKALEYYNSHSPYHDGYDGYIYGAVIQFGDYETITIEALNG